MYKTLILISLVFALAACKYDQGTKTGLTFQDCTYVAASEREGLAKGSRGMPRDEAIAYVAEAKGITPEQAATCFK
jgi:hypothetical protein